MMTLDAPVLFETNKFHNWKFTGGSINCRGCLWLAFPAGKIKLVNHGLFKVVDIIQVLLQLRVPADIRPDNSQHVPQAREVRTLRYLPVVDHLLEIRELGSFSS